MFKLVLILYFVFFVSIVSTNLIKMINNTLSNNNSILKEKIANIFCCIKTTLVYVYYETYDEEAYFTNNILQKINLCHNSKIFVKSISDKGKTIPMNDDKIEVSVLIVLHRIELNKYILKETLEFLNLIYAEKHRTYIVVVVLQLIEKSYKTWLTLLFEIFWEKKFLNVVVLFMQSNEIFRLFTYSPFNSEFLIELLSETNYLSELFYDKLQNLNGYVLRVSIFQEEVRLLIDNNLQNLKGTDGYITIIMLKMMNASMIRIAPPLNQVPYGEWLPNGSASGSLGQIIRKEADVAFNTRFLRLKEFMKKVEVTHSLERDDLCFMVPKAGEAAITKNMFLTFDEIVWASILLVIPLTSFIIKRIYSNHSQSTLLRTLAANLNQSIGYIPPSCSLRWIIAGWILYCLIITNSYQGNLTTNLLMRCSLSQLSTFDDLAMSGFKVYTFKRYIKLITDNLNISLLTDQIIISNLVEILEKDQYNRINSHDLSIAYADKYHVLTYKIRKKQHIVNDKQIYHLMPHCPVPYLVAYIVPYGSPYTGRINIILRMIQEAGLMDHWSRMMANTSKYLENDKISKKYSTTVHEQLAISHLQTVFYVLFFGIFISTLCIFLEIAIYKYDK